MEQRFKNDGEGEGAVLLLPAPEPGTELIETRNTGGALAAPDDLQLPRLITDAGETATLRFINFFTAEIENDNTRMAYLRAFRQFDAWCLAKGIGLYQ